MICGKLADGKITAIDRSAVAINAAKQASVKHVRSGKAAFHHTELAGAANLGPSQVLRRGPVGWAVGRLVSGGC